MKKRVISLILVVCMAVSFASLPAYASDYNYTYYTQIGWKNNNGTTLNSMCFLTSIAMLVSDLGKKVTPVDVYYANGGVVSCSWGKICGYYGLTYDKVALNTYADEAAKCQVIADALTSGKYPAGILVIGRTNNVNHMVVARRVVNGVIYCDDPVNGSDIPISKTRRVSENIISYWTLVPNSKWSSSGTGNVPQASDLSASETTSGTWIVTIPANYKLLLYSGSASTSSATYVSARSEPYTINCSQKAMLSNGAVRYYARFNTDDHYWFDCTSSMSAVDHNGPKTHTINFDANGGSVSTGYKQVTAGGIYGELPTPTRDGYSFDGWFTAANGGEQVTASTAVNLPNDQITLYAHWTENEPEYTTEHGTWTQWSDWSANYVEASDTRQVETQQNMVTEGRTEYRYGRYVDSSGTHDCWCSTYLEHLRGVTGSAILDYSDWSTTQYSPARPHWTCGFCNGNHINVDHYSDDGRAWWKQYILPTGSYYWEESKWVEPAYETQYRYRDWVAE